MKKFKSQKRQQMRRREFIILLFIIVSFSFFLSYFSSIFAKSEVLQWLVESSVLKEDTPVKTKTDVLDFLLDYTIGRQNIEDEIYDGKSSRQEYIPDPKPEDNQAHPLIYIYNTHQGEEYKESQTQEYNVIPTVMLASYYLREKLNAQGLQTIVENNRISEVLRIHQWNYASSYQASKLLMQDAYTKNPSLQYFFDLHRDSISYENSTLEMNGKKYAKILFVIGIEHDGYEKNLEFAQNLSDAMNQIVPTISRGILKKGGAGVNGIYNQDFSSTTLLFELGGEYNCMEEISNTIDVLSQVLKEEIKNGE